LLAVEQRIEGMEELLLRAVLAGEELDVVDQQRVDLLEVPLERIHGLVLQGLHHRAEELLGAQVQHPRSRIGREHRVAGGEHQVRLAQARAAIQKQRIMGTVAGFLRRLPGRGAAELVAAALDEIFERVMAVEIAGEAFHRALPSDRDPLLRGGQRDARLAGARQGTDLETDLATTGKIRQQFADAIQVACPHFVADEGIGRI
jgi:hypothetical protein